MSDATIRRVSSRFLCASLAVLAAFGCEQTGTSPLPSDAGGDASSPTSDASTIDSSSSVDAPGESGDAGTTTEAGEAGDAGPAADIGPGGDFRSYADAVAAALQGLYDSSTGLFPSTGWWNSANDLTALIDYSRITQTSTYVVDIATTFAANNSANFLDAYDDDEGWWALAWIDAFDLTHNTQYLSMAETIFADMAANWDTTCLGGIWWDKAHTYKNAIANELFFLTAIRLHERTPNEDAGPGSYFSWATLEWNWFSASGMINSASLVNDGLTSSCTNNGETTWTYNQGVLIGALVELAHVNSDPTLLTRAQSIADATMQTLVDPHGVLHESCEPSCGADGPQFKGIFMRHLAELTAATGTARDEAFITTNADWVWNAARNSSNQIGLTWPGPFDSDDGARQGSGLDALNAAIPYTAPEANAALFQLATANGSCATDQTAAQAFDGTVTTKWCSGPTNGAYWLEVDLGQSMELGRIIARHAGAGGESQAWNTLDFTLSASSDDNSWNQLVAVTGNTLPVTIHRFPSTQARYVRMDITAAQTDPNTVAARIDELETYAR